MTHLIHLITLESIVKFGKHKYVETLLPIAERAQSDRAEQYIEKIIARLAGNSVLRPHMPEYDGCKNVNEKTTLTLMTLEKRGIIKIRHTESRQLGHSIAHLWYSDLNKKALESGLTMFEWMLALVTYTHDHESQRAKYLASLERKKATEKDAKESDKKKREVAKLLAARANLRKGIVKRQKGIDEIDAQLTILGARPYDEPEIEEFEEPTIQGKTEAQKAAENRFADTLKDTAFF